MIEISLLILLYLVILGVLHTPNSSNEDNTKGNDFGNGHIRRTAFFRSRSCCRSSGGFSSGGGGGNGSVGGYTSQSLIRECIAGAALRCRGITAKQDVATVSIGATAVTIVIDVNSGILFCAMGRRGTEVSVRRTAEPL